MYIHVQYYYIYMTVHVVESREICDLENRGPRVVEFLSAARMLLWGPQLSKSPNDKSVQLV